MAGPGLSGGEARPIVLAGFEPFLGRRGNSAWDAVQKLEGLPGLERVQLPVDFARLGERVMALRDRSPRVILLVGESSRKEISVEQMALNVADSDDPDNAGRRPRDEQIVPGGPLALRATWDARAVAGTLAEEGIPAFPSFHAGTYVCNAALYLALHGAPNGVEIGFLHLPRPPGSQAGNTMATSVRAVELALRALSVAPAAHERETASL